MALTEEHAKEDYGAAYVAAVAAASRCAFEWSRRDYDSVDGRIWRPGGVGPWPSPEIRVQLKCTGSPIWNAAGDLAFDLPVDDYDDLRATNRAISALLVVTLVPNEITSWLDHSGDELLVRHCTYWASLSGSPATGNTTTTRVVLPQAQMLDVEQLTGIMDQIEEAGIYA